MSLKDFRNTVIFSVSKSDLCPLENEIATNTVMDYVGIHGIHFMQCDGCYNGTIERSFIINGRDILDARLLAIEFDQECIMTINDKLECHLQFMDGAPTLYIGVWTQIDPITSTRLNGYTLVNGLYYTAIKA